MEQRVPVYYCMTLLGDNTYPHIHHHSNRRGYLSCNCNITPARDQGFYSLQQAVATGDPVTS